MSKSITQDVLFRQSIVRYAQRHGLTAAAVRYKKCRSYVHYWLHRYDGTLESLQLRSRRPHSNPKQHTEEELKWIADCKRRNPTGSLIDVWVSLTRNKGYQRSIPGLYRAMKRMGYYTGNVKKPPKKSGVMEPMSFPGERIQIDCKFVPKSCLANPETGRLYQYTAIDEFGRVRYIEGFDDNSTYTAMVFLVHALKYFREKYGFRVRCVQTDNGREYTTRFDKHPKPTLFEETLKKLGIRHKLIRPYTPRHNGKVERSHREDQLRFYNTHKFYSLEDLNAQLKKHLQYTNNRPMRPLGYLSPNEFVKNFFSVQNV